MPLTPQKPRSNKREVGGVFCRGLHRRSLDFAPAVARWAMADRRDDSFLRFLVMPSEAEASPAWLNGSNLFHLLALEP
jgi:hypothetical protein